MRTLRVEGIIIKRRNFGEADRMLTVVTRDLGKISVKATGVRKITSRRSAHVELLNVSMLHLYRGRGIPVLTEAQTIESFSEIKNDLRLIAYAYHVCELIAGLCPENQENRQAYFLLRDFLSTLHNSENAAASVYDFELSLLRILGYWRKEQVLPAFQVAPLVESILERKLKSRRILPSLL